MTGLKDYTLDLKAETRATPHQLARIERLELRRGTYYRPLVFFLTKESEPPVR